MPLQKGYKTPKLLMKSVEKLTGEKVKEPAKKKKKKKMGKITYRKSSKPVKENIIDARAGTRETGKELIEKNRLDYEKKLNRMLKNIK